MEAQPDGITHPPHVLQDVLELGQTLADGSGRCPSPQCSQSSVP